MAVLGHRSANMAMTDARISDPEVRRQYEIALTNGSRIAVSAEGAPCIDVNRWESRPTNVRKLSEHVSRLDLELIPHLTRSRWFHRVSFTNPFTNRVSTQTWQSLPGTNAEKLVDEKPWASFRPHANPGNHQTLRRLPRHYSTAHRQRNRSGAQRLPAATPTEGGRRDSVLPVTALHRQR
jgi:hypothetical protein